MNELAIVNPDGLTLPVPMPADRDPALVYLTNNMQSAKGRYTQGRVILQIASWLNTDPSLVNWSALRYQHVTALCTFAASKYKPATARKYRAALIGIARQAFALELMSADHYQRIRLTPPIKGKSARKTRYMSQGEINAIMDMCAADPSPAGPRDGAIISLLYVDLIRREGVSSLSMSDYQEVDHHGQKVGQLLIHGKGNKENTVYVMDEAKLVLDDWLTLRGTDPGPLFYPILQNGVILRVTENISDQSIYNIVKKRCEEAGVENVSPHDFRHTGIGRMIEKTRDTAAIARVAGHENVNTTAQYDPRGEESKIEVSSALHIKWKSRKGV